MRCLKNISKIDSSKPLARVLSKSILFNGFRNEVDCDYLYIFNTAYNEIDHIIRFDLEDFNTLLDETISNKC